MKYIFGVDVDSVLRDFPHDLVRVIKREHPEWYNEDYPVPDQWEMDKCFNATADEINNVYWHEHTAEIMGNGTPIKVDAHVHWPIINKLYEGYKAELPKKFSFNPQACEFVPGQIPCI